MNLANANISETIFIVKVNNIEVPVIILNKKEKQTDYLEEYPIFISYPSDLIDEKKMFFEIIELTNNLKAKSKGILLEGMCWEDTLPAMGRPQEKINEDFKKSRLVVMLLWKRWGSSTGKYSSGFEEEFEEAQKNGTDIWVYFRDIPNNMLEDPGEQLKKVLEFQNKIETEKTCLFRRYKDQDEWKKQFCLDLMKWLDQERSGQFQFENLIFQDMNSKSNETHQLEIMDDNEKFSSESIIEDKILEDEYLQLGTIMNPNIRFKNNEVPYFQIETNNSMQCSLYGDFFGFTNKVYFFSVDKMGITLEKLWGILKNFYFVFRRSYYHSDNPSFLINQVCNKNNVNYSWFGYGPKNFIQALKEQNRRYSKTGIVKPHHRELACFVAEAQNNIFSIAFQPNVHPENSDITLDYVEISFITGNIPFDNRKFLEFYDKVGLGTPDFIFPTELDFIQKNYREMNIKLKNEGFLMHKYMDKEWISKVVCNNPFYGNKDLDIFQNEKLVINLRDHHPFNEKKQYFLEQARIITVPSSFDFKVINLRGNW